MKEQVSVDLWPPATISGGRVSPSPDQMAAVLLEIGPSGSRHNREPDHVSATELAAITGASVRSAERWRAGDLAPDIGAYRLLVLAAEQILMAGILASMTSELAATKWVAEVPGRRSVGWFVPEGVKAHGGYWIVQDADGHYCGISGPRVLRCISQKAARDFDPEVGE